MIKNRLLILVFILTTNLAFSQKSEAFDWVGKLFQIQFDSPQEAIDLGNKILKYPNASPLEQSYALIGIGTSYSIMGKSSKAIPYLTQAIKVAEKTTNYELRVNANLALANLYTKMNLHEQSYHYILKAKEEIQHEPNEVIRTFSAMRISTQLGQNLNLQLRYDESLHSYQEALKYTDRYEKIRKEGSVHGEYSMIYSSIGETLYNNNSWKEAEVAFNKALSYAAQKKENYSFERAFNYSFLGKIYFHQGDYEKAIKILKEAAKFNDNNRSYIEAEINYTLAQAYSKIDQPKNYTLYNEKYLALKNQISNEEKNALSESIKNEMRIVQEQEKSKKINLIISGVLVSFIISLALFVNMKLHRKRKEEKRLFQITINKLQNTIDDTKRKESEVEIPHVKIKKTTSSATEDTENKLLQKLEKFEKSEAFLSPRVSLSYVASQFGTNQSYISELVNASRGKSFNQYINELRIDYICKKIYENSVYQNYKISHLAELTGYPSHTAFAKIFKKITGISPSVFIANAKENNSL